MLYDIHRLGRGVFELCHLPFSFMFAIVVDDYIDKRKGSSEGVLPGFLFGPKHVCTITLFIIDSAHQVSWKKL